MTEKSEDLDALFDLVSAGVNNQVSSGATVSDVLKHGASSRLDLDRKQELLPPSGDEMYGRLGSIVRSLHDSLRELGFDKTLSESAISINDAKDRLAYIATLTEAAATKVLNTLDQAMPSQDLLSQRAREHNAKWEKMLAGDLSVEEFKLLALESRAFSADVVQQSEAEKARLMDIMMAQDFQDLTGQIIKKVIQVTHAVEGELAQLLHDYAPAEFREKAQKDKPVDLMSGPAVPASAMVQDDVDGLLADLGF